MNEIFAIDPSSPKDYRDFVVMLNSFGLKNGKFIAKYPNDWVAMLLKHSECLKEIEGATFKRLLSKNIDALLDIEANYQKSTPWIDNALEVLPGKLKKSSILSPSPAPDGVKSLQDFLYSEDSKPTNSIGDHIPMTVDSYCKVIKPLLNLSTEVHLVDKFFELRDGLDKNLDNFRLLSRFLKEADQSKRCEQFKIYFVRKKGISDADQKTIIASDINEIIDTEKISNVQPDFCLKDKHELKHGRYIFSIKGGLQFDYGFKVLGPNKTNHVHWLSEPELLPIQKQFGL